MNKLLALCAIGATKVLGNEIKKLGFSLVPDEHGNRQGKVMFLADDKGLYKCPLCLRSADRVYLVVAEYSALDFEALFSGAYSVPWQDFFLEKTKIIVDKVRCHKSKLDSQSTVQSVVHKAIYQKLCDRWHIQKVQETGNTATVRVYIDTDDVLLLLDITGEPLHKRGYRLKGGAAPLRETTAFVLLQMLLWKRKTPLLDLFCGAGTIPIEAWLYAYNVPCGISRSFSIKDLAFYDRQKEQEVRLEAINGINTNAFFDIRGFDIDRGAVSNAKHNAKIALLQTQKALQAIGKDVPLKEIAFEASDYKDVSSKKLQLQQGLILSNPPYGERLEDEVQARALYQDMGLIFENFCDFDCGFITCLKDFAQCIKKRPSAIKPIKNGKLDTNLYIYKKGF